MISLPPAPHPGDRVTAELLRNIIRCLRAATPLPGPGILLSRGPNGTVVSAAAASAPKASSPDRGCWTIVPGKREVEPEEEGDEPTEKAVRVFANRYYSVGGLLLEHGCTERGSEDDCSHAPPDVQEAIEDFVLHGELTPGEEYTDDDAPFVALKVRAFVPGPDDTDPPPVSEVVGYKSFAAMAAASQNRRVYLRPLYQLTHAGSVLVDFRNLPPLAEWEVSQ